MFRLGVRITQPMRKQIDRTLDAEFMGRGCCDGPTLKYREAGVSASLGDGMKVRYAEI